MESISRLQARQNKQNQAFIKPHYKKISSSYPKGSPYRMFKWTDGVCCLQFSLCLPALSLSLSLISRDHKLSVIATPNTPALLKHKCDALWKDFKKKKKFFPQHSRGSRNAGSGISDIAFIFIVVGFLLVALVKVIV